MEKRLCDCIVDNVLTEYVLPFFWQHGEEHSILREEMDAIQKCGINEFCVESRTHEQFGEEQWWEDFGFLLQEAKKRGMRVWLLDDKSFPTGYANNYIESFPELRAVRVRIDARDVIGPQKDIALVPSVLWDAEESIISVVAYQRVEDGNKVVGEGIPLMSKMKDGLIWWDIPEGNWRVYYVIRTRRSPVERKKNYIDMMSEESCRAMLYGVYEPHYEHFKEYFGNTFAGFFSDEPGFGNESGTYHSLLGREEMVIPWNDDLPEILAEKTGYSEEKVLELIPALWYEVEGYTTIIRENYMEAATEAFSRNFSRMLGDWCRAHGVKYIGHVIEDDNAHQRLGHGCGHYFRALAGQDMGGIDIVLHQYIAGMSDMEHMALLEEKRADPAFFRYMLPKLASSYAHIQPLKQGRSLCEIYGGFGWAEGVPEMKQMSDLMLAGGINYFVPHAFNARYPDLDHPPYFYARGMNSQFPIFRQLMKYVMRMSHVLSGGKHQADVAVYYNAEAEWSGGRCQLQQEVCKEFGRNQVEFDILPQDTVCNDLTVEKNRAVVNGVSYGAVIIPYSQFLPERVLTVFAKLAEKGLPVWFINDHPDASSEGKEVRRLLAGCRKVPFAELVKELADCGIKRVQVRDTSPSLRYFHTCRNGYDVIMLWNESIFSEVDTWLSFQTEGTAVFYDAWNNKLYAADQKENSIRIRLAPTESIVLYCGNWEQEFREYDYREQQMEKLELTWDISLKEAGTDDFVPYHRISDLHNLAHELPGFGGVVRYECEFEVENPAQYRILEFEVVGEVAELWINEKYCGSVVGKPYRFCLDDCLKAGRNKMRVEVMTNLAYKEKDIFSSYVTLPITGLGGMVLLG